jgi:uncharacterized protein
MTGPISSNSARGFDWRSTLLVTAAGAIGAVLFTLLGVPAGALVGAVLGSAVATVKSPSGGYPRQLRVAGMILLGCAAGSRVNSDSLPTLLAMVAPTLVGVVVLLVLDVVMALVLHRRFGLDLPTALLACAPGGVSEMATISTELGARSGIVVSIHLLRVLLVVLVTLPVVLGLLGTP